MKSICLSILLLISISLSAQQAIIAGRVTNSNKEPIAEAQVALMDNEKIISTAVSSEKGNFMFQNVGKGIHTIKTTHPSYDENFSQIRITNDSENQIYGHMVMLEKGAKELSSDKKSIIIKDQTKSQKAVTTVSPKRLTAWKDQPMPAFSLKDMDGKIWTEQSIIGKPTVINFWHTGCGPCIKEMPDLNEWITEYPEANYLSCTWNSLDVAKKVTDKVPFLFHNLVDGEPLFNTLHVIVTPATLVIDKDGIIRLIIIGASEQGRGKIINKVKELGA